MPVVEYAEEHQVSETTLYREINSHGESEDAALVELVKQSCLQMFMNCMPPRYRAVYTLRSILGCSIKESADILEIKPNSVKVYLHRARRIASDHMAGKCSLVHGDALCNCRGFAAYLSATGKLDRLSDLGAIVAQEEAAKAEFTGEMEEVFRIQRLYMARFSPGNYSAFMERLRERQADMKLLGAGTSS